MRKHVVVVLSVMVVVSLLLAACSGNSSKPAATDKPATDNSNAPVELSVFAPQAPGIVNLDVNKFSKYVEDQVNIKFNWSTVPDAAFGDKKQLLLASGDYPALMMNAGMSKSDQIKYGQQGAFIPLNDLIDQYAPNIKKVLDSNSILQKGIVAPDGNIYALPRFSECLHCTYYQRLWINTKWLDKLGLSMPTTTEEFYNVLKAFKEKDPNGNGKADEIPLTTSADGVWGGDIDTFLMNAFIYDNSGDYLTVRDGKVIFAPEQPEWKEGLKYLRKLFAEGLIDKGVFTQNNDAVRQMASKPEEILGAINYSLIGNAFTIDDANPAHRDYDVVPPLKGPGGVQLAGYTVGVGSGQFVITNKASKEQQIAAIKLADFLWSEEPSIITNWGFEGEGWKKAESGQLDFNGVQAIYDTIPQSPSDAAKQADTWWALGTENLPNSIREAFVKPSDPLAPGATEYRLWLAAKKYEPFAKPELVYPADVFYDQADAMVISQLSKTLSDYVKSSLAQFVTGNKDIDKDWDSYIAGFKGMQLDQLLAIYQKALDAINK